MTHGLIVVDRNQIDVRCEVCHFKRDQQCYTSSLPRHGDGWANCPRGTNTSTQLLMRALSPVLSTGSLSH